MPQSLSKVYIHVVFSTKHIQKVIPESLREELQRYIIGCLSNIKSYTEEIYINPDHLHALCTLPRTVTIAQLVSKMKAPSSKWLKTKGIPDFDWQDGYGAFSVSASGINTVKNIFVIKLYTTKIHTLKMSYDKCLKNMVLILMKSMFGIKKKVRLSALK